MSHTPAADSPVLAVLLAGGRNRRYHGQLKALETVGDRLIAERATAALRAAADRVVLVANDAQAYEALGLETRPDLRPGLGALGGIHTAVCWAAEASCRGALVAACDMPFLSAGLLQELAAGAAGDEVVAPESTSRRGLEPLCAFYGVGCRTAIESALDRGDRQVISFFPDVRLRKLPMAVVRRFGDPDLIFLNVNTPADRARAERAVRSQGGGR